MAQHKKIAIIFPTIERKEFALETIKSLHPLLNENLYLFIGDQNKESVIKTNLDWDYTYHYQLEYDCGLSATRNYLVKEALELGFEYCLISADSIRLMQPIDAQLIIEFLEQEKSRAIVGLKLKNRVKWDYDLELIPKEYFILQMPKRPAIKYKNISFQPVDICKNFFIAKTSILNKVMWDNQFKLGEHEDFFWRLKEAGYKTFSTDFIQGEYIDKKPADYNKLRLRLYSEFLPLMKEKYHLQTWIKYGEGVLDDMRKNEYR